MKLRLFSIPALLCLIAYSCNGQTPPHGANLSWTSAGITGATYTVQRSSTTTGPKTTIQSGITGLSLTDSLPANTAACYFVFVSAPGFADGPPSDPVCGTSGKDQAPKVTGLSVVFF